MRLHKLGFDGYGAVQVATGVATADSNKLILMLFDGLLDSLNVARGHIQHGNIIEKGKSISRASRIVLGLQVRHPPPAACQRPQRCRGDRRGARPDG